MWTCGRKRIRPYVLTSIPPYVQTSLLLLTLLLCTALSQAAIAQNRHVLLIGGLGGDETYASQFQQYLFEARRAFVDQFQVPPAHVVVLAEPRSQEQDFVNDVSTAENIRAQFARLARAAGPDDHVYILLFGHGSHDGQRASLNIPRRDLSDADYADLLDTLSAGRIVFINTASASAPFIEALSAPDRIVITATRSPTQRNETVFPEFLVEALTNPAADLDKNGDLSVREVFDYAAAKTAQSFEATGHLATEHALLEDTGDARGYRAEELEEAAEGNLAAVTYFKRGAATLAAGSPGSASPEALREREALEREIAELKGRKAQLSEDAYYEALETLFVRLARLNESIEN